MAHPAAHAHSVRAPRSPRAVLSVCLYLIPLVLLVVFVPRSVNILLPVSNRMVQMTADTHLLANAQNAKIIAITPVVKTRTVVHLLTENVKVRG